MKLYKKSVLKSIGSFVCGLILLFTTTLVSFADNDRLTYEEAVKLAVRNNRNVRLISQQIDDLDVRLTTPRTPMPVALTGNPSLSAQLMIGNVKLSNASKTTKLQLEALLDGLELQIKSNFYKIASLEDSISLKQLKIEDASKRYELVNLRNEYGVASRYDLERVELDIRSLKEELESDRLELKKAYDDLRVVLGVRTLDKEIERLEYEFIPVDDLKTSPEHQAAKAVADSVAIFAKQKAIEEAKLDADFGFLEYISAGMTQTEWTVTPIPIRRSEVRVKNVELRNAKEELYFRVVETYNTLKTIEAAINQLNAQMNVLDQNIRAMETRLNVGVVTQREVDDLLIARKELLQIIDKLKFDHTILRMQYQNPHLMSGM